MSNSNTAIWCSFIFQAVYLKQRGAFHGPPTTSSKTLDAAGRLSSVESTEDKSELFVVSTEDPENGNDRNDGSEPDLEWDLSILPLLSAPKRLKQSTIV